MKRITRTEFIQYTSKHLKEIPFIVTSYGEDDFIVSKVGGDISNDKVVVSGSTTDDKIKELREVTKDIIERKEVPIEEVEEEVHYDERGYEVKRSKYKGVTCYRCHSSDVNDRKWDKRVKAWQYICSDCLKDLKGEQT